MTAAFNLAQLANNLNTAGQLDASDGLTGVAPVANGGTGRSTLTANSLLVGNGTTQVSLLAPSTSGNFLTSNGTSWSSQAPTSITNTILGFGQTLSANLYPSSRTSATTYTNSGTRPRVVVLGITNIPGNGTATLYINGNVVRNINAYGSLGGGTLIVPPSATYRIELSGSGINYWEEY